MGMDKLRKFAELKTFANTLQPKLDEHFNDYEHKGQWATAILHSANPIVLELGCGKGEYTVGLARQFKDKTFIGVDRKGNRIWKGAKIALDEAITNAWFLRTHIDKIDQYFGPNEVSEIWITFPDPQPQKSRERKRLTHQKFLTKYAKFLKPGGIIHLKTDSQALHEYTLEVIAENGHNLLFATNDLYNKPENKADAILGIRTFYESMFLEQGLPITYLKFTLKP